MQPSDEIKSRIDIVDLIREYIPVKAAGANFRARCPFHREKTPSFMISPEKQIWHCFGCGKGGDIFSFVMEMEGVEFVEALRILAPKAGVTLKKQDPKMASQRNRLLDIVEISRKHFCNNLLSKPEAKQALEYLRDRGLSRETIEEWQIGYSLDSWDGLLNFLRGRKFKDQDIFLAGMAVKSSQGGRLYDRFRARIMFPINDVNSNTVAFSARVSPEKEQEEKMGKYINSPQTPAYDKSKILFGLDKAKLSIKNNDYAIIVEGQMDAISVYQNGYKNVIASSGTALTEDQIRLLKRYTGNIFLAFDMDQAGAIAADRGIKEAMKAEMNIRVIVLPEGKDPDECIRNNPEIWKEAVKNAKPMMQYYFDLTFGEMDLNNVDSKRQAARFLLPIIAKLGSGIDKDYWLRALSEKIDVKEEILRETLRSSETKDIKYQPREEARERGGQSETSSREEKLSELVLALAFKFPELIEMIINRLQIEHIIGPKNKFLYKNLIFYYNNIINNKQIIESGMNADSEAFNFNVFKDWLNEAEAKNSESPDSGFIEKLIILGDENYHGRAPEEAKNEIINISLILKRYYYTNKQKELIRLIAEAEKNKDDEQANSLMEELKILSDESKVYE